MAFLSIADYSGIGSAIFIEPAAATEGKPSTRASLWQLFTKEGKALVAANDYQAASKEYLNALGIAKCMKDYQKLGQSDRALALCFRHLKEYDQALLYGQEALTNDSLLATMPKSSIGSDNLDIAETLTDANRLEEALSYAQKGVAILESALSDNNPNLIDSWQQEAKILRLFNRSAEATALQDKARALQTRYMESVQKKIKANWSSPRDSKSNQVVVSFDILTSGEPAKIKIIKSSDNKIADDVALAAVHKAAPFESFRGDGEFAAVHIDFSFAFNRYNNTADIEKRALKLQQELDSLTASGADKEKIALKAMDLAKVLARLGKCQEASAQLDKLLANEPLEVGECSKNNILFAKGTIQYSAGQLNDATATLKSLIEMKGFDQSSDEFQKSVLETYAKALYKQGKEAEAKPIYDRLKQL